MSGAISHTTAMEKTPANVVFVRKWVGNSHTKKLVVAKNKQMHYNYNKVFGRENMIMKSKVYKELLLLMIPLVLQNIFSAAVHSADTVMIGLVSQDALSAVSLANQIQMIINPFFFGLTSGVSIMTAQYWGRGDMTMVEKILGFGLKIAICVTMFFAVVTFVCPRQIMQIFTTEAPIIEHGITYLRIVAFSYVLNGIAQIYECSLKATKHVKKSTTIVTTTLILNVVLNALFIFGWLGLPELGVAGVALGTLLARLFELGWCLYESRFGKKVRIRIAYIFERNKPLVKDFMKYALPLTINGFIFGSTTTCYSIVMGRLGGDVVAANSVAAIIRSLALTASNGLATAAGIYLGALLGSGKLEQAKEDSVKIFKLSFALSAVGSVIILLARPFMLNLLELTPQARSYLSIMMYWNAWHIIPNGLNLLLFGGINCSGGDTKFGLICDMSVLWGVMVPVSFILAFWLKVPPLVVYAFMRQDELLKLPFMYKRYKSYKWVKNITK